METIERTVEKGLVGYLLCEYPDGELLRRLNADWFSELFARRVVAWVLDKYESRSPVDMVLACQELPKEETRYIVESLSVYRDSGLGVPEVRDQYVAKIRKAWADKEMAHLILDGKGEEDRERLKDLMRQSEEKDGRIWKKASDIVPDVLREIEDHAGRGPLMPTGFKELDAMTDGLHPGELWTVGAYTSVGKTVCLTSFCHRLISRNIPVLYMTTEMSYVEYVKKRLLPVFSDVHSEALRKNTLTKKELESVKKGAEWLGMAPLTISDRSSPTLEEIYSAVEACRPQVLFVDHLHRCQLPKSDNKNEALNEFMRGLKTLAREKKIPIIAASQFNRASQASTEPSLAHLRDSGALEMESDVVLLLNRKKEKDKYSGRTEVSATVEVTIAKNRGGPCGWFNLLLSTQEMLLVEL